MSEETQKHTLHFYRGDFQRLQELYPEIGASLIVRKLVRKHIEGIEAKIASEKPTPEKDIII